MTIQINSAVQKLYAEYADVRYGKSRYTSEERRLKAELLGALAIDTDTLSGPSEEAIVNADGEVLADVVVGATRRLNVKMLREKHPDIYAECEQWSYPVSIKHVAG